MLKRKKLIIKHRGKNLKIICEINYKSPTYIVFIHGLGCDKQDFLDYKDYLKHSLISFDIPGFGGSTYGGHLDLYDLAEIISKVIEKLKISNFILISHSLGSVAALLYLKKYSSKVKQFINIEGTLETTHTAFSKKVKKAGFKKFKNNILPEILRNSKKSKYIGWKKYFKKLEIASPRAFFDYSVSHANIFKRENLFEIYVNLKMPKIFVYGQENKFWNKIVKKLKQKRVGQIRTIPKGHHLSFHDNPKGFFRFLKKVT